MMDPDLKDLYPWCTQNNMYIDQEDLVDLILNQKPHVVFDSRDDDQIGGHVHGSYHIPDSEWDAHFPFLIEKMESLLKDNGMKLSDLMVIFHCMESVRRGPRCAYRLTKYFEKKEIAPPIIKVLQGGAHCWIHNYHSDVRLVEDFDNEYWGILPFEGEEDVEEADEELVGEKKFHREYIRPSDQPASEWSEAGQFFLRKKDS